MGTAPKPLGPPTDAVPPAVATVTQPDPATLPDAAAKVLAAFNALLEQAKVQIPAAATTIAQIEAAATLALGNVDWSGLENLAKAELIDLFTTGRSTWKADASDLA